MTEDDGLHRIVGNWQSLNLVICYATVIICMHALLLVDLKLAIFKIHFLLTLT